MRVALASFHVAGHLSVNLRLRFRWIFQVIYGLFLLIINISEALVLREIFSLKFTILLLLLLLFLTFSVLVASQRNYFITR